MVTWTSSGRFAARRCRGSTSMLETRDFFDPDLTDLVDLLPSGERYSYVFDGTAQTLDHMLVSESLRPLVSLFTYVRGNADSPEAWRSDVRRPERISDHDAALAYFRLRYRLKQTTRVSVISSTANGTPSRPTPLDLVPPNGMTSSR